MSIKPKRLLFGIVVALVITNILTLLFWNQATNTGDTLVDHGDEDIQPKKQGKDVVASIDGKEITYQDWMYSLRKESGKSHLKEMINKSVVEKLFDKKDVAINDKVIKREIAFLTTMQGIIPEDEVAEQEEIWEEEIRYRYQLETLLTEDVTIPEEEVREFYGRYKNQYNFTASFQLSHIIVPDMDTADRVTDELNEGASFDLLAKEYSLDEDTQTEGGYLGYFTEGSQFIPHGYDDQIEDMEEYSYSDPFQVGNDVAIIYLHRYIPEIKFTYEEMKPYVALELALEEIGENSAEHLWDELDVEWEYE